MNFPSDLKYTSDHEWVRLESEDVAVVGITDYAQDALGELVYVEVETVGDTLAKGEVFGTVEAVKTTSDLFMPVSGEIIEFNAELDGAEGDNPAVINEDAYNKGWIVKIRLSKAEELTNLLDAEAYQKELA